jgi:exonuclease I
MNKEELYELKYVLAEYIYPRLKAFKEKVDRKETPTLPNFKNESYFEGKKMNVDLMFKFWSERLEEMLFPFEYYNFPEKFEKMEKEIVKENTRKGLEIFAKYFDDLWI